MTILISSRSKLLFHRAPAPVGYGGNFMVFAFYGVNQEPLHGALIFGVQEACYGRESIRFATDKYKIQGNFTLRRAGEASLEPGLAAGLQRALLRGEGPIFNLDILRVN